MKNLPDYLKGELYLNNEKENEIIKLDSSCQTSYRKGQLIDKEDVIDLFEEISSNQNDKYYVGITCDTDDREDAHNVEFIAVVDCPSIEEAKELEKALADCGFDAGGVQGNVHKLESKKVYIYKKAPNTNE